MLILKVFRSRYVAVSFSDFPTPPDRIFHEYLRQPNFYALSKTEKLASKLARTKRVRKKKGVLHPRDVARPV